MNKDFIYQPFSEHDIKCFVHITVNILVPAAHQFDHVCGLLTLSS